MMFGLGGLEPVIVLVIIALIFFFGKGKAIGWIRDIKEVATETKNEETEK